MTVRQNKEKEEKEEEEEEEEAEEKENKEEMEEEEEELESKLIFITDIQSICLFFRGVLNQPLPYTYFI